MTFDPEIAAIRFGTGLSPALAPTEGVGQMLTQLQKPDNMAIRFPIGGFDQIEQLMVETRQLKRKQRDHPDQEQEIKKQLRMLRRKGRGWQAEWLKATIARGVFTEDGLRERLALFWADHFTVKGKNGVLRNAVATYVEAAIRPHLTSRFSEMLKAATFHPMMLHYLDQINSIGPNSLISVRKPGRGLNENLAREVLELHTLGVGGAYTQTDVRELAKLFAGLTYRRKGGFTYAPRMAEPGPETILGKSYGGYIQDLFHVTDFLDDLAIHPDTARHLAQKLVVHFVSDVPDGALVEHIAAVYLDSGGDLMATYKALLSHPIAWTMLAAKVKQPIGFVISALRALDVQEQAITGLSWKELRNLIIAPLGLMGQPWENPVGPDGWPEDTAHWITPQGLAARIQWAMTAPARLRPDLPDPRQFIDTALGARAGERLRFAATAAEAKPDGIGLILASPEFQRS